MELRFFFHKATEEYLYIHIAKMVNGSFLV